MPGELSFRELPKLKRSRVHDACISKRRQFALELSIVAVAVHVEQDASVVLLHVATLPLGTVAFDTLRAMICCRRRVQRAIVRHQNHLLLTIGDATPSLVQAR